MKLPVQYAQFRGNIRFGNTVEEYIDLRGNAHRTRWSMTYDPEGRMIVVVDKKADGASYQIPLEGVAAFIVEAGVIQAKSPEPRKMSGRTAD